VILLLLQLSGGQRTQPAAAPPVAAASVPRLPRMWALLQEQAPSAGLEGTADLSMAAGAARAANG
jgi:hypothetical protein